MELLPHQQRVVEEKQELRSKLDKLNDFIMNNDLFKSLDTDEQFRLREQAYHMGEYDSILGDRIEVFTCSAK